MVRGDTRPAKQENRWPPAGLPVWNSGWRRDPSADTWIERYLDEARTCSQEIDQIYARRTPPNTIRAEDWERYNWLHERRAHLAELIDEQNEPVPWFPEPVIEAISAALGRRPSPALLATLFSAVERFVESTERRAIGKPMLTAAQVAELKRLERLTGDLLDALDGGPIRYRSRHALMDAIAKKKADRVAAPTAADMAAGRQRADAHVARVQGLIGNWAHGSLRHVGDVSGLVEALVSFEGEVAMRLSKAPKVATRGAPRKVDFSHFVRDVVCACHDAGYPVSATERGGCSRVIRVLLAAAGTYCPVSNLTRTLLPPAVAWAKSRERQQERDASRREWAPFLSPLKKSPSRVN